MQNIPIPVILIPLLSLIVYGLLLIGFWKILDRTGWELSRQRVVFRNGLLAVIVWVILLFVLSLQGFFADFSHIPPRVGLAIFLPLIFVLYVAFSRTGTELLRLVPAQWLVFLQTFRILVELILWIAFIKGLMPVQMSFEGRNFDVFSGLLALPVGYYCLVKKSWPRGIVVIYNIIGLLLMINVISIAVLSMPTPLRYFHNEPSTAGVGHFPFIFLPGLLVPLAYMLHIFSLRQLFAGREE